MNQSVLEKDLIKLAKRFDERGIKFILAGGYGLIIKHRYVRREQLETLCDDVRHLNPRSTMDLDLFLEVDLIADPDHASWLRNEIQDLGYEPSVKYFQFRKSERSQNREVDLEIDLLSPPPEERDDVHIKKPRLRAKDVENDTEKLHAYQTNEAITVDQKLTRIQMGESKNAQPEPFVYLPNPFSYLILKFFAFRDRKNRAEQASSQEEREVERDQANAHAFDTYAILAMTTEEEWDSAEKLVEAYDSHEVVNETRDIISNDFLQDDQPGIIAIKEQASRSSVSIDESFLNELPKNLKTLFRLSE